MGECLSLTREAPPDEVALLAKVAAADEAEEGEENLDLTKKVVKHKVKPLKNYQAIEVARLKKSG